MNWTNYRLLVDDLKQLPPERFDYGNPVIDEPCGCVAVRVFARAPECAIRNDRAQTILLAGTIGQFLGITQQEAVFVYGEADDEIAPFSRTVYNLGRPLPEQRGTAGIAEALRRLAVVAARYGGEPAQPEPVATFQPDEAAFLRSVRELIAEPTR